MALAAVSLDDKYDLSKSLIFVTGFQALIRLTLMQKERDRRAGLNTACYVTGYRGSPLAGFGRARRARRSARTRSSGPSRSGTASSSTASSSARTATTATCP